jgi:hypothetical protein
MFSRPTFRVSRRGGALPDVMLSILDVRSSKGEGGPIDEALYCVLGCPASPVWVSVASLKPLVALGEILT